MQSRSILFRVDTSSQTGLGHLRRTLALGMVLKRQGHAPVYLIDDGGEPLPLRMPLSRIKELGSRTWDLGIVDSYTILPEEFQRIRSVTGHMAVVADGTDRGWESDVLIDHNLYATDQMYSTKKKNGIKLLVGPRYAMINEEIVRARSQGFSIRKRIRRILLTLGGTERASVTVRLLKWIHNIARGVDVFVVMAARNSQLFLPVQNQHGNHYHVVRKPPDIGRIMRQVDLAISAAGVTSLELACIGVPAIQLVLSDNQLASAKESARQGICLTLGKSKNWNQARFDSLYRKLESPMLRSSMSRKARSLVDGRGVLRLAKELTNLP